MDAITSAPSYCDPEVFRREQDKIFSRAWSFAGVKSAVAEDNSWITAVAGGKSVVVQNFGGELRCFVNVCSHRFCEIRHDPQGNGPLRCPYHGWTYNSEGLPVGIPHRPRFDNLCIPELGLIRYRVELCGELIFVNPSPEGPDLRTCMGSFFDRTESLAANMGPMIHTSEWTLECNWKIWVENTLEAYHIGFVHPGSFAKLKADYSEFRFDAWSSTTMGHADMEAPSVRKFVAGYPSRPHRVDGYLHYLLFPAFLMASTYGVVTGLQQIVPESESRTFMKSWLFHRKAEPDTPIRPAMEPVMHEMSAEFNKQVLREDRGICEAVQRGIRGAGNRYGLLSDEEKRVGEFQKLYARFMDHSPAPAFDILHAE